MSSRSDVAAIVRALTAFAPAQGTFVVGITGSVASGKSTLAGALAGALGAGGASVALIATDGFLYPNQVIAARGLELRKGFPETYDLAALAGALAGLRGGAVTIPAYSHVTYDIDPAAARIVDRPAIAIVEGLALGLDRPAPAGAAPLIDALIYLDAAEADLEAWFVARFMEFWRAAEHDPASFYARFRGLDAAGAESLAHQVWSGINLPNLRGHIAPVRAWADLIVTKAADHSLAKVASRRP